MRFFLLSAVIIGLAVDFPQTLSWLTLFFLTPILYLLNQKKSSGKKYLPEMWLFGFGFSLISTLYFLSTYPLTWLSITSPLISMIVVGGMWVSFAALMAVPIMFWPLLVRKLPANNITISALIGASVWVLLEYVRSWFIALALYGSATLFGPHHTYYVIGYPLTHTPFLKDLVAAGGLYLAGFFIILSNYLVFYAYSYYKNKTPLKKQLASLAYLMLSIIVISNVSLGLIRNANQTTGVVQTTIFNTQFPTGTNYNQTHRNMATLLAPIGANEMAEVIITPEGFMFETLFVMPYETSKQLLIGSAPGTHGKYLHFDDYKNQQTYLTGKSIQMPIGDYRLWWTDRVLELSQNEKWIEGYFQRYPDQTELPKKHIYKDPTSSLSIVGTICSDNISPYIYRDAVLEGATFLTNIASHAPFRGSELLTRQTISVNTARALETGRYFAVASNFDNSTVITDEGDLIYESDSKEMMSYENIQVELKSYLTPYVRFGDYILIISALIIAVHLVRRQNKK